VTCGEFEFPFYTSLSEAIVLLKGSIFVLPRKEKLERYIELFSTPVATDKLLVFGLTYSDFTIGVVNCRFSARSTIMRMDMALAAVARRVVCTCEHDIR
jgi:hypothetical protein